MYQKSSTGHQLTRDNTRFWETSLLYSFMCNPTTTTTTCTTDALWEYNERSLPISGLTWLAEKGNKYNGIYIMLNILLCCLSDSSAEDNYLENKKWKFTAHTSLGHIVVAEGPKQMNKNFLSVNLLQILFITEKKEIISMSFSIIKCIGYVRLTFNFTFIGNTSLRSAQYWPKGTDCTFCNVTPHPFLQNNFQ